MKQQIEFLKQRYPDINFRINDGKSEHIYYVITFYCCVPNNDFFLDVREAAEQYSNVSGVYLDDMLIMYKNGYLSEAIAEIERLRKIKPFHMICDDNHMNKRFDKENGQ